MAGAIALLAMHPASAQISGRANVLGGDTLSINGQNIRLYGIDAIEFHQFCYVDGQPWACGAPAIRQFQTLAELGRTTCEPTGEAIGGFVWAVCELGGLDLAEELVRQGLAIALREQTDRYAAVEDRAREARQGIWAGIFVPPATFRETMALSEDRIRQRAHETIGAEVDAAMLALGPQLAMFQDLEIGTTTEDGIERRAEVGDLPVGFVLSAVPPPGIFNWQAATNDYSRWRAGTIATASRSASLAVWAEITARVARELTTDNVDRYVAAINAAAAPIIEEGRQPVLVVRAQGDPVWIAAWRDDNPAGGVTIEHREGLEGTAYVVTVDGIDIYTGPMMPGQSLVFPADVLATMALVTNDDGAIVQVSESENIEGETLVFTYGQVLTWRDGDVVSIRYPDQSNPYAQPGNF
ncbi:MAG: thermonuclease family protein [Bauldia sp.]|nr:thermonuclease family protein [Bauldia sp.]